METLAERITREGPVNELDAVGWIVRLAKKLESIHARGLAHGAVSPEAMKTASASRLSLGMLVPTGATRNRLEFRSPERLDTNAASPTDDTWSTAATLYALITGSSPFVGVDDDATRKKIRAGAFSPLSTFDVGDDDLQHIIEGALNPVLAARTSSMAAFRQALEGWHPDSKVRDLPPMVDDQLEDDDEDARTVMRPVSAADAVRQLIAQREQAAAASRPPEAAPQSARETVSSANQSAGKPAPASARQVAAQNHGLLEDDEEAATSMISIPPLAYLSNRAPAMVPAPPASEKKPAPPVASGPPLGPASRALSASAARAPAGRVSAKATVVGGFTAKQLIEQHQQQQAQQPPPVAAPTPSRPGISREAVLDDGDNEATVMREAPLEILRQATGSIVPPAPDRTTPVDPTSAAVAAMTMPSVPPPVTNLGPAAPEASTSLASVSMLDDVSEGGAAVEPRETPVSPSRGLKVNDVLGGAAPAAAAAFAGQTPAAPPAAETAPTSGLATPPATSGMGAPPVAPPMRAPSSPAIAVPTPVATPAPAPLANAPVAPPPATAAAPAQPSALKGLLVGVGLAILILAAAAAVYFFVVKR